MFSLRPLCALCVCGGEFVLPDSQPEFLKSVGKILTVNSQFKTERAPLAFIYLLLLTLWLGTASCKSSDVAGNQNGASAGNIAVGEETTSPPFATREPERYQATRVITGSVDGEADAVNSQTFIARDGDKRREDYESPAGLKLSLLQLAGANYVLLPAKKIYAELTADASATGESVPPDFSPDKLLNEARTEARYENLGAETVGGRSTRKYRVTVTGKTGAAKDVKTETLIWVDDSLGMPVKSETRAVGVAAGSTVVMELRDIKETVDAGVFDLPQDYKRVEYREILAQTSAR
jgi:outer membrane lipoprotein-sorting protein